MSRYIASGRSARVRAGREPRSPEELTVFAPTDEAFDALPEGVLDALLLPENKDALTSILTYHVVSGEVMAADVTAGDVPTVEGSDICDHHRRRCEGQ
jgi:uncharacterized surface protein with fasciclin (FAS1) repeats